MSIRLAVTDDHELVRAGLVQFLGSAPGIEIAVEAANGIDLLKKLNTVPVDLLLLDMYMPGEDGTHLISHLKRTYPDLLILVLSGHEEVSVVKHAISAGASGFISKNCSPQILLNAIESIIATGRYLSPQMAEQLAYASTSPEPDDAELVLSPREMEIFRLLVEGNNVGEIASQLFISDKTVSTHKGHLLEKLGLKNTAELVRYALQRELFP